MTFWIATGNKGKSKEFLTLLSPYPCYFLKDLPGYKAPEETGSSFEENARIKALALKKYLNKKQGTKLGTKGQSISKAKTFVSPTRGVPAEAVGSASAVKIEHKRMRGEQSLPFVPPDTGVVGEDSGLEVLALGGAPGIYSARYAGHQATDKENVDLLLKNMRAIPEGQRQAVFVSHIVALFLDGREYSLEGRLEGVITRSLKGNEGFGYDPVFVPKGEKQTLAELGVAYKNRFSHRAKAVHKLLTVLNNHP